MDATRTNADWAFISKKPFGFLMSLQTGLSLFIVLLVLFAPFVFEGVSFVSACAFTLFFSSLIYNLFHIMGWNRKVLQLPGGINVFVPCTLWVFAFSVIFFFLFSFDTLICLVGFFDSFRFTVRLIITYFFLSLACAGTAFVCLRLGILLFRAAPNSQILALTTVLIDGEKTSRMEGSAPQFTPATSPTSNPV
ncbi:Sideroflexin-1 [Parelaphostrongylus tenuis]|nr:Sideroflexin-1 [Parelaphostrongylus tenuis]